MLRFKCKLIETSTQYCFSFSTCSFILFSIHSKKKIYLEYQLRSHEIMKYKIKLKKKPKILYIHNTLMRIYFFKIYKQYVQLITHYLAHV